MKTFITAITAVVIGSAVNAPSALADTATDALSTCFADNTTGKDRKEMARWTFAAMASHPEIKALSNVTQAKKDEIDKSTAILITKLLTENCLLQTRSAMEKDGGGALKVAFGVLGRLAMQELISNPNVNASLSDFGKYIDEKKFNSALSNK